MFNSYELEWCYICITDNTIKNIYPLGNRFFKAKSLCGKDNVLLRKSPNCGTEWKIPIAITNISSLYCWRSTSEIYGVLKNTVHEEYFGGKHGDIRTIVFVNIKWPWHFASGVSFSRLQCTNFDMFFLWLFGVSFRCFLV